MLTTRRKIQIARVASGGLRGVRRLLGRSQRLTAQRGGLTWHLDLAEGIDLAIYLNVYQRPGRYVRSRALRSGMTVLDIGANIGAFTLPLAVAVAPDGKVIAIEATEFAFAKLQANVSQNPEVATRIITVQAVLGADDCAPLNDAIYASWPLDVAARAEAHPAHGGRKMGTAGAMSTTLDTLLETDKRLTPLASSIDFVKLDVDGHELDVLLGARRFLEMQRPLLLIEIAPYVQEDSPDGQRRLLAEIVRLGYGMRDAETGTRIQTDYAALARLIPYGAGIDVLCEPL